MDQEKIGKLIAKLRKSKGLTQRELGDMVGVGFRAVSKWETGLTSPDISIINDLSKILGISADELLKGEIKEKLPSKNKKNVLPIIAIILTIILVISIFLINKNRTYMYELIPYDNDYYIEGEMLIKNKRLSLKINKIDYYDNEFKTTIINNYQYEITCDNNLIVGYGYTPSTVQLLPTPISIEEWINNFKINYTGDIEIDKQNLIKNGLNLKITFINKGNNQIIKNLRIKIKKQK